MNKLTATLVLVAAATFSISALAQSQFYAGHAGQGGGETNPGAFSSLDLATGNTVVLGTANATGGGVAGLASDGTTIYAALAVNGAAQLVTINPLTGTVASVIGDVILNGGGACAIGDLAMGAGGVLWGMTSNGINHVCDGLSGGLLVTIDTATGQATAVGRPYGQSNIQGGLAVDGAGNLWYSPGWNHPNPGELYILDQSDGQIQSTLVLSGEYPNDEGANGLVWNPDNGMIYASFEQQPPGNTSLWMINPTTGAGTLISDTTAQLHDMVAFGNAVRPGPFPPVPTLSGALLAVLGAMVLFIGFRRLRRQV